ncbi:Os03g0278132 [Oryza sativa Japonica Group]|uniref:Os03g0278132 protein n=2 Tax=Oryza sativa subsp. japonica TaxID=39947 RepID=Q10N93_ORYSJ|nr:hypothetical protein LOC_Os03g16990 [Oryza sativa Japonica Group]EAZ26455.1 hypothetical protein OsJ_10343 [Oryza sativa Japonica Group]BAS83534.1 Os03g0278132 [Oryza sativa Japonica Group]
MEKSSDEQCCIHQGLEENEDRVFPRQHHQRERDISTALLKRPSSVSARTLLNQYRSACSIALPQAILRQCEDIAEPMPHAILRQREDIAEPTPLVSVNARTSLNQCPSPVSCRRPLRHTTFTGLPDATTSSHVVGWATSLLSPALTSQCYRLDRA